MGGDVGFETEVGKGSSFWIEFPAIEKTGAKPAEKIEVPEPDDHLEQPSIVATVLYIEDNPVNLQLLEAVFDRMNGLTLISAHNAELALMMAEERQPDLILMDLDVPGMDAIAAMQGLGANDLTKDIPVIAISAGAGKNDVGSEKAAGFKAHLTKPINLREVIEAVKKELDA
ncbi:MAG: response regulator [Rhodospirillales bacterium]|nr:response regulator [Rhodospirillales bacterium]